MYSHTLPAHGLREILRRQKQIKMRQLHPTGAQPRVHLAIPVQRVTAEAMGFRQVDEPAPTPNRVVCEGPNLQQRPKGVTDQELFGAPIEPQAGITVVNVSKLEAALDERDAKARAKRDRYNAKRKELRAQGLKPTR